MLLFGYSFTNAPAKASTAVRQEARHDIVRDDTVAPASCKERHRWESEVDGLGHYIDSRFSGELFRID